jgi:hypothetical protein
MLTKVLPLTENGRLPAELTTGGAGPPRVPVKVWTLSTEVLATVLFRLGVKVKTNWKRWEWRSQRTLKQQEVLLT